MKPEDYKHIKAWGHMMKSYADYIYRQQQKAAEAGAPLDAIYERDGKWHTFDEVTSPETKRIVESYLPG